MTLMARQSLLVVGDNLKAREFVGALAATGVLPETAPDEHVALRFLQEAAVLPDGIVFIVPVYWEAVGGFVEKMRKDPRLKEVPIIYLGDFIESNDQLFLKRQGVHTLTLGPVPMAEAVRFVLRSIESGPGADFDIMHPKPGSTL